MKGETGEAVPKNVSTLHFVNAWKMYLLAHTILSEISDWLIAFFSMVGIYL